MAALDSDVASLEALEAALADNPYVLRYRAKLSALKESDVETYRKRLALIQQQQGTPEAGSGPPPEALAQVEESMEKRRKKKVVPSLGAAATADARAATAGAYGFIAVAVAAILFCLYQGLGASESGTRDVAA